MAVLRLTALAAALVLAAPGAAPSLADPHAAPPPAATMQPAAPDAPQLPERLDHGGKIRLPPMTFRQDPPPTDHSPAYLGAGLVALALLFWWNRRRRDRFDREDGITAPPPRRRRSEAGGAADAALDPGHDDHDDHDARADADDLAAAARGDGPEPPAETPTEKSSP